MLRLFLVSLWAHANLEAGAFEEPDQPLRRKNFARSMADLQERKNTQQKARSSGRTPGGISSSLAAFAVNAFEYLAMVWFPHPVAAYCICTVADRSLDS